VFLPKLVLGGGLAALIFAAAYWTMPGLWSKLEGLRSYTPSGQLGLQVVRAGESQLNLSWNPSAPHLGAARKAKLTIKDGTIDRELDMDSSQLQSGKVTYFPSGTDVQLRLEVYIDDSHSVAESVRVLLPRTQATTIGPASAPDSAKNGLTPVASGEAARQDAIAARHAEPVQPAIRLKAPPFVPPQPAARFREIHPSRRVNASLRPPDMRFQATTPDYPALNLPLAHLPIPTAWSVGAPRVATRSNPTVSPSPQAPVRSKAPVYVPPRPIKRVIPDTSLLRVTPQYQFTQIEIEVRIDPAGHVVGARPVSGQKQGTALLIDSALAAARKWTFEPAIMNGKAIPVDYSIVFAFHPAPQ
jgi:TonB-like protein